MSTKDAKKGVRKRVQEEISERGKWEVEKEHHQRPIATIQALVVGKTAKGSKLCQTMIAYLKVYKRFFHSA